MKRLPMDVERQLIPGTCEHALAYLINPALDLSELNAHDRHDEAGAPAFGTAEAWVAR
jgi:hypothetical protein